MKTVASQTQVCKSARRVAEAQYSVAIVCACALDSVFEFELDECSFHLTKEDALSRMKSLHTVHLLIALKMHHL